MSKALNEKLAGYLAATAAVSVTVSESLAQNIIYTDINPDVTVNNSSGNYNLDVDGDNVVDFVINNHGSIFNDVEITPLGSNEVLSSISPLTGNGYHFGYPTPLNLNQVIGPAGTHWFSAGNQNIGGNPVYDGYGGGWPIVEGGYSIGPWATDKYIGLRFMISGQLHYGWVRVQGSTAGFNVAVTVKDYAYESTPSTQILAGDMTTSSPIASPAGNVVATDVSDNVNGSDLEVAFDAAANESTLTEYRIMVVKAANAAAFDTVAAAAVTSANYTAVNPTGANQTVTLAAGARDVNGDPVKNLEPYRVFVMSVANGTTALVNALSPQSNLIELTTPTPASGTPGVSDIADNGNGDDLQVTFQAATPESILSEYRVLVVKSAQAPTFTVAQAFAAPSGRYVTVPPLGSPSYTLTLGPTMQDTDGDPIVNGETYRVFVLSVADGVNAVNHELSAASVDITLETLPSLPTNLQATDEGNTGDPADIRIRFTRSPNENLVDEYRVMFVTAPAATSFSVNDANNVTPANYLAIAPSGVDIDQFLPMGMTDVNGNVIPPNTAYRAFVLVIADGTLVLVNELAGPSADVTLIQTAPAAVNVQGSDVGNDNNGTDLEYAFDAASNETFISDYRAIAVKSTQAPSFDLTAAQALPASAYAVVNTTGSPNYSGTFGISSTDADGDPIQNGVSYNIFIWSVADQIIATNDSLSAPSGNVSLSDLTSVGENQASSGFRYLGDHTIQVLPETKRGEFQVFDVQGALVDQGVYQPNERIRLRSLRAGIYFFRTSSREVIRFSVH